MSENGMGISRRGFVAGGGATALGVGLAGGIVGCAPGAEKESEHTAGVEKTAYDPKRASGSHYLQHVLQQLLH